MTTEQVEQLKTLERVEAEALKDVKNYEYWLDKLTNRYLKVRKAREEFEQQLNQK